MNVQYNDMNQILVMSSMFLGCCFFFTDIQYSSIVLITTSTDIGQYHYVHHGISTLLVIFIDTPQCLFSVILIFYDIIPIYIIIIIS